MVWLLATKNIEDLGELEEPDSFGNIGNLDSFRKRGELEGYREEAGGSIGRVPLQLG